MKRILFTVTNDLTYDQRMNRICSSLVAAGYDVTLIGRKRSFSEPLRDKPFRQKRIRCLFNKGKLFYLEYNFRLFFYLLFQRFDIMCGIDLDTILPTYMVAKLKRKPFVYDAHEYFTEMEEVVARPAIKRMWTMVEQAIVPRVKYGYTVSEGYARMFGEKYGTDFEIIRNATVLEDLPETSTGERYILYQGAVNVGRGLDHLIRAMQHVNCKLYICGKGDVFNELVALTEELGLQEKVTFWGYIEPDKLKEYTRRAAIGITFFSNAGLSNQYSLANRFFDYMHAGVPQVAMRYPQYENFNREFEVAKLIDNLDEKTIAGALNHLLSDRKHYEQLRRNCLNAREVYNWQNEAEKLCQVYRKIDLEVA